MKKILPLLALAVLFANACTAQTPETETPIPSATIQPTLTEEPTPTTTQTITPTATASGDDEPTPLPANVLTYKNAAGEIVSVKLPMYQYTNKKGEVVEIVQPPDPMACLKLLADRLQWHSAETDQPPLNKGLATDPVFRELWNQFDYKAASSTPYWVSAYPSSGWPFMTVFVAGWEGGTLLGGQGADGEYFFAFCPVAMDDFGQFAYVSEMAGYQYLQELAAEHQ